MSMSDVPKMQPGSYYYFVTCSNCGKDVIFKEAVPVTGFVFAKRDAEVTCWNCGTLRRYTAAEVSVGVADPKG